MGFQLPNSVDPRPALDGGMIERDDRLGDPVDETAAADRLPMIAGFHKVNRPGVAGPL